MTAAGPAGATTAAVLVGGEGRRLGGVPKHRLAFPDGETVLARLVALLMTEVGPTVLVSRAPVDTPLPVVLDRLADRGAAAGVHAALGHAPPGWVFVASCDLPLLDAASIRTLAAARAPRPGVGAPEVVLYEAGGFLQPLAAFWHTRALPRLEAALADAPRSLRALVAACDARVLAHPDPRPFTNINTPEDLAALGLQLTACR